MKTSEPTIVERAAQPYVAITASVPMTRMASTLPPLNGEVFGWLEARGIAPAGAPLWKYNVIDMDRELEIEVGVPVAEKIAGDDRVRCGVLPAGRYATLRHVGHPDELVDATGSLLRWADGQGLRWDVADKPGGERWAARVEFYLTDPADEPDLNKWETDLAFKLAD
ncbi:GyrI-like domain-containing protein [Actinopolymorpha sp. NPDC004070]|uniref:GyrI-like domain-containing protein n=1 Tax=Actinopolymorpha sp. NPDC004070 TaxID=3154548 RepID=UPI00339FE534